MFFSKSTPTLFVAIAFIFAGVIFFGQSVFAAPGINQQIHYQGLLKDSSGNNVSNGSYDIVFRLYDAASGGTTLWTGTHTTANGNAITVTDGVFSVLLGSGTGNSLSSVDFDQDTIYLGVTVGSDSEMTPRQRIGAAAQAFNADRLDGISLATSTLSVGDILYFDGTNLGRLAAGTSGQVLKIAGSVPSWATDLSGGSFFSTTTNELAVHPADTSDVLILGGNATTTTGNILETIGNALIGGALSVQGIITGNSFTNGTLQLGTTTAGEIDTASGNLTLDSAGGTVSIDDQLTVAGTTTLSNLLDANSNRIINVATPTGANDATNKSYVDSFVQGLSWQEPVLTSGSTTPPGSPSAGDRHVVGASATGAWASQDHNIAEWNGSSWDFASSTTGYSAFVQNVNEQQNYNGTEWVQLGSGTNHASLSGLQGGNGSNQFFHLTQADYNALTDANAQLAQLHSDGTPTFAGATTTILRINGESFTDLTGNGLSFLSGALTVATSTFNLDPSTIDLTEGYVMVGDPSGNAQATSSFFISQAGNVGIGDTAPEAIFTIQSGDSGVNPSTAADDLFIEHSSNAGLTIASAGSVFDNAIYFADAADSGVGRIVYSHSNNALTFFTNSSEQLRVDSDGNLGVGTSSPFTTLGVSGDSYFTATSTFAKGVVLASTTPDVTTNTLYSQNGTLYWNGDAFNAAAGGTEGQTVVINSGGTQSATSSLFIAQNGNIGIATSTPSHRLTVTATSSALGGTNLKVENTGSGDAGISFGTPNLATDFQIFYSQDRGVFLFGRDGTGDYMSIASTTGNVGIGTTSPISKLTVAGDITPDANLIYNLGSSTQRWNAVYASSTIIGAASTELTELQNGTFVIRDDASKFTYASASSTGFGILTDTPDNALTVNGGISIASTSPATTTNALYNLASTLFWNGSALQSKITGTEGQTLVFNSSGEPTATSSLFVASSGNIGVGDTAPEASFTVANGDSGVTPSISADDIFVESSGSTGLTIGSGSGFGGTINFADSANAAVGRITYGHGTDVMAFYTNGAEALRINSSGNVGIGTTSPFATLSVSGDSYFTATSTFAKGLALASSTPDLTSNVLYNQGNTLYWSGAAVQTVLGGLEGYAVTFDGSGNATTSSNIFFASGGNIGIGTTSPSQKLDVEGNIKITGIGNALVFADGTTMTTAANVASGVASTTDINIAADTDTNGSGAIFLATNGTNRMVVANGGNVGIGSTTPNEKLVVAGTSGDIDTGIMRLTSSGNQVPLYFTSGSGDAYVKGDNLGILAAAGEGGVVFETLGFGIAYERMRIDTNGNVGIGTTSPFAMLSVASTTYFAATSTFAQGLVLASSTPEVTDNALYNQAGTLFWNGSAIGNGATGIEGQTLVINSSGNQVATSSLFITSIGSVGIGTTTNQFGAALDNKLTVNGGISIASSTPATTTNALYNQGGTLYWNGSEVGSGSATSSGEALNYALYAADGTGSAVAATFGNNIAFGSNIVEKYRDSGITYNTGTSLWTLPAGKWRMMADLNDASNTADPQFQFYNNDTSTFLGAEGQSVGQGATFGGESTAVAIVNLTTETDIAIRATSNFTFSANNGSVPSFISFEQLPATSVVSTAQAAEYLTASLSGDELNFSNNDNVTWNTVDSSSGSSISLDTGTGIFTLQAGKTYRLSSAVRMADGAAGEIDFAWYNITNSVEISQRAVLQTTSETGNTSGQPVMQTIFAPSVNTQVSVRAVANANGTEDVFADDSYAIIETIADGTSVAQFGGATASTAGSSGFIPAPTAGQQNALLLGGGSWLATTSLQFNTTVGALNIGLGTSDTSALSNALFTVGSTTNNGIFYVGQNGNVSIGSTSPSEKLDVNGNVAIRNDVDNNFSNSLIFKVSKGGSALETNVGSTTELGYIDFSGFDGTNYERGALILAETDGVPGNDDMPGRLTFWTTPDGTINNSERMRIDNVGNVSIGTTANSAFLHVSSSTASTLFRVDDSGNGDSTSFVIDGSGNVGIGTTTPGAFTIVPSELTINSTDSTPGLVISNAQNGVNAYAQMMFNNNVGQKWEVGVGASGATTRDVADDFFVHDRTADATRFVIANSTGYVGIGTSSPESNLHIYSNRTTGNMFTLDISSTTAETSMYFNKGGSPRWVLGSNSSALGDDDFFLWDYPSGAHRLVVQDITGYVGLGVASPETSLHVVNSTTTAGDLEVARFAAPNATAVSELQYITLGETNNANDGGFIGFNDAGNYTQIGVHGAGSLPLVVTQTGVGIGQTVPGSLLHVYEDASNTDAVLEIETVVPARDPILSVRAAGVIDWNIWVDREGGAGNAADLRFGTGDPGGISDLIRLTTGGDLCDTGTDGDLGDCASDENAKQNIQTLTGALEYLSQYRPVTFDFKDSFVEVAPENRKGNIGLIAQEVQAIDPNLVEIRDDGYLRYHNPGFEFYLISAIQELSDITLGTVENALSIATSTFPNGLTPALASLADENAPLTDTEGNKTFVGRFFERIAQWLADTANGIGKLFAGEVHTNRLCVGNTCVTEAELQALLAGQGSSVAPETQEEETQSTVVEIVMNGNNPAEIEIGASYKDPGALASSTDQTIVNLGVRTFYNDIEDTNPTIDTSVSGEHTIVYRILDAEGNIIVEASRSVIVSDQNATEEETEEVVEDTPETEETSEEGTTSEDNAEEETVEETPEDQTDEEEVEENEDTTQDENTETPQEDTNEEDVT